MAEQTTDEYELEEKALAAAALRAQAKQMRMSGNPIIDATNASMDRVSGIFEQQDVEKRRRELTDKLRQRDANRQLDDGKPPADYAQAVQWAMGSDPVKAKRGQYAIEHLYNPVDPAKTGRITPTGDMGPIQGAVPLYRETMGTKEVASNPAGTPQTQPDGTIKYVQPPGVDQNALPKSNPQPSSSPVAPPALGPASPVAPPPGAARSGPITPASAPVSGGSPALPATMDAVRYQVPGESQIPKGPDRQAAILLNEFKEESAAMVQEQDPERRARHQRNVQLIGTELRKFGYDENRIKAELSAPAPQQAPQNALAQANPQGIDSVQRPVGPEGGYDPVGMKRWQDASTTSGNIEEDQQKKMVSPGQAIASLDRLDQLNKKPTWEGGGAGILTAAEGWGATFGYKPTEKYRNTKTLNSEIQNTLGPLLKQYGQNPSNLDLASAAARLPSIEDTAEARADIIAQVRRGMQAEQEVQMEVQRRLQEAQRTGGNVNPKQIENQVWQQYNNHQAQQRAMGGPVGNPTQPGGAESALSGAVSAQGGGYKNEADWDKKNPSVSFFKDRPISDLWNSAKSLPGALASQSGRDAIKDSWGNVGVGAAELLQLPKSMYVDPNYDWATAKDAQDKRRASDPDYNQSRVFYDIANPTALIGGTATSVPKMVMAGALTGALQPGDGKVANAALGAGVGLAGAVANKVIPSTTMGPGMNRGGSGDDLLKKFPSFKPTSSQLNQKTWDSRFARFIGMDEGVYGNQAEAITKDLMAKTGTRGDELSLDYFKKANANIDKVAANMFPSTVKARVGSQDVKALNDAISLTPTVQDAMAKAPTLAAIHTNMTSGNPVSMPMSALYAAWKEAGHVGDNAEVRQQIRSVLEGVMAKGMQGGDIKHFHNFLERRNTLKDLEMVWAGGGSTGTGPGSGFLSPSKILTDARGGNSNSMKEAAQLINKFRVRNSVDEVLDPSILRDAQGVAGDSLPGFAAKADQLTNMIRAPQGAKTIAELLRMGAAKAPQVYNNDTDFTPQ